MSRYPRARPNMPSSDNLSPSSRYTSPRYWIRSVSITIVAVLISVGVSYVARRLNWAQPEWLSLAAVYFFVFALSPDDPGRPPQGWISRVIHGLIAAAVGSSIYAMLSNW
jgi:hypothetical protein